MKSTDDRMLYFFGFIIMATQYLNAIDLEYSIIDNISLQEVRMNISVRYHEGKDKRGEPYPMHPLDEVQENINQWMKRFFWGQMKIHGGNIVLMLHVVTCALILKRSNLSNHN